MAERLVDDMSDDWSPERYRDTYSHDLMKRIEARVRSGDTHVGSPPGKGGERPHRGAEVIDLVLLLRRSIEEGKSVDAVTRSEDPPSATGRRAPRKAPARAGAKKTPHRNKRANNAA